ncbi:MAG: flagellar protein FlaG [Betaproteobacteria bacterium]|nr:flagellar protein FlaG [Betaproteobacteria bacterium]
MGIEYIGAAATASHGMDFARPSLHAEAAVQTAEVQHELAQSTQDRVVRTAQLQQAVDAVAMVVEPVARDLRFSIDDTTGRTVVKVLDVKTDELIRQIPAEEVLDIAHAIDKLQGLLIRQRA